MPEPTNLLGELTKRQRPYQQYWFGGDVGKPEPGTYKTYRQMRLNPTMALARACARAPVSAADHSYEADDGIPEAQVEFIRQQVDPIWRDYNKFGLNTWDYGWQSFEIVYRMTADNMQGIDWLKPLAPEETSIELADDSDRPIGVIQNGVHLRDRKYALLQWEDEPGNPYGVSRMEGLRETAWGPWNDAARRLSQYMAKVAGVVLVIQHPTGQTETRDGSKLDNAIIAERLGKQIATGSPIGLPRTIDPMFEDALRSGKYDLSELMAWQFKFLETSASHGDDFTGAMDKYETLMVRGWLLPERAILEGKFGTKAEASTHGDVAVSVAEDFTHELETVANERIIDALTWLNFGHRGRIRVKISPLIDERLAAMQALYDKAIASPTFGDAIMSDWDMASIGDILGVPRLKRDAMAEAVAKIRAEAAAGVNGGGEPVPADDPLAQRNGQAVGGGQASSSV